MIISRLRRFWKRRLIITENRLTKPDERMKDLKDKQNLDSQRITRDPVISLSRILGMIFIVICHIISFYPFIPGHAILGRFFNCGVYLFIFISGYLYGGKAVHGFGKWYAKRILTVALPAIIVSAFTIVAFFVVGNPVSVSTIVVYMLDLEGLTFLNGRFFGGLFSEISALVPLWFTTVIMLCYLLVPLLQAITSKIRRMTLFTVLLFVIGLVATVALSGILNLSYFLLFSLGYCLGKLKFLDKVNTPIMIMGTVLFVLAVIGRVVLHKYYDGSRLYIEYVSISHFIVGNWFVLLIAYVYKRKATMVSRLADWKATRVLDDYSFYVYLVHGIFIAAPFNLYGYASLPVASVLFVLCTVTSAVIVKTICSAIQKPLLKKLSDEKKAR